MRTLLSHTSNAQNLWKVWAFFVDMRGTSSHGACPCPRYSLSRPHINSQPFHRLWMHGEHPFVDKWHVSVDKPPHLGKGGRCGLVFVGFSGTSSSPLERPQGLSMLPQASAFSPAIPVPSTGPAHNTPQSQSPAIGGTLGNWAERSTPPHLSTSPLHISPGTTTTSSINI